jgi:uncharacterized protein YndB with AHSA1/START domain
MTESADTPDLTLVRVFDAPPDLVFRMWTQAQHLAHWWGPRGFSTPVCEVEARAGGAIRIQMRGPDGTVYPLMVGTYEDFVPSQRLTILSSVGDLFRTRQTFTFDDVDGKTKVTLRAYVLEAHPGSETSLAGMEEGWNQTLDRLSEYLAK